MGRGLNTRAPPPWGLLIPGGRPAKRRKPASKGQKEECETETTRAELAARLHKSAQKRQAAQWKDGPKAVHRRGTGSVEK